jgi:hypothetical protein
MLHFCETSIGKATYRRKTVTFNSDLLSTAKLTHKINYFLKSLEEGRCLLVPFSMETKCKVTSLIVDCFIVKLKQCDISKRRKLLTQRLTVAWTTQILPSLFLQRGAENSVEEWICLSSYDCVALCRDFSSSLFSVFINILQLHSLLQISFITLLH